MVTIVEISPYNSFSDKEYTTLTVSIFALQREGKVALLVLACGRPCASVAYNKALKGNGSTVTRP